MEELDDVFVADAVTHAYNQTEENWRVPEWAEPIANVGYGLEMSMPEGYSRTREAFLGDWPVEATENTVFRESQTDFAVFHPQSIMVFHDGLTALEKAEQFVERNPTRGAALASIDAPTTADELGIDDETIIEALTTAHEIRDRYTILGDGMSEAAAREAANVTGVI